MKNNRGELSDILLFLIVIFILATGFFIIIYVINPIANGMETAGMNNSAEGVNAIAGLRSLGTTTINNGFLMLFVGLIMSTLITSFFVRTHPIFLFLYVLLLGITIFLSFYLGNIYYDVQNNPIFADIVNDATYINFIMNHIAEITLATGAISIIVVFSKFSTYGGTQQF